MTWVIFFAIMWIIVGLAFYTWYRAIDMEKRIREIEKR